MSGFEDIICYYKPHDRCFSGNFSIILSENAKICDYSDQFEIPDDRQRLHFEMVI